MGSKLENWTVRAFFSIDIVNSTLFKTYTTELVAPSWVLYFQAFYDDIVSYIDDAYCHLPSEIVACLPKKERLRPWKCIGDEVLFCVKITDHLQILPHVLAVKNAVAKYSPMLQDRDGRLGLKAAGWIAGFPVTNHKVATPDGSRGGKREDYIGPSVDLGFRVAKLATERRFVLTADLALMVLHALDDIERYHGLHLRYQGRVPLKGVLGDLPYPICWICMKDGTPTPEDRLTGWTPGPQHDDLKAVLEEFARRTEGLRRLFIVGSKHPTRYDSRAPAEMLKVYEELERLVGEETEEPDQGKEPTAAEVPTGDLAPLEVDSPDPEHRDEESLSE